MCELQLQRLLMELLGTTVVADLAEGESLVGELSRLGSGYEVLRDVSISSARIEVGVQGWQTRCRGWIGSKW